MQVVRRVEVAVVGGGPAGSACAARLVEAGRDVVVVDQAAFPREKLCAGWITPEVVRDLNFDIANYPYRFNTFDSLVVHVKGVKLKLPGEQHSIRRYEFDDYLLKASGAPVLRHRVRDVSRVADGYLIDDQVHARYVVGAGGTRCPVYRGLFREANPRAAYLQAATLEHEFDFNWHDGRCHLWFLQDGLPGYSWYVPKADGMLNCGLGAMAVQLRSKGGDLRRYWQAFAKTLAGDGLVAELTSDVRGYSYFLRGDVQHTRIEDAFIVGDAAGLATRDLCEGIGPAVRSGQRAAEAIIANCSFSLDDISAFSAANSLPGKMARMLLEYAFCGRGRRLRSA